MLVFDGECSFCNRAVQFILAHEHRSDLLFVPRDSALGLSLRAQCHLERVESLLWIAGGQAFIEWDAVAHTAEYVTHEWRRWRTFCLGRSSLLDIGLSLNFASDSRDGLNNVCCLLRHSSSAFANRAVGCEKALPVQSWMYA
jgi:hypothetical protein